MARYVGALDHGTTSTRFMVFDHDGTEVGRHQLEHAQIMPQPGHVEHDADEIVRNAHQAIERTLTELGLTASDLICLGVTNQRETTVLWDRRTGEPLHNAIVWQDTRHEDLIEALPPHGAAIIRERSGLLPATYFAGGKIAWLLRHVPGLATRAARGEVAFGTTDSWLVWQLTGGPNGGRHVTDVTNASRTMLMDLDTLAWDEDLLALFDIPRSLLPTILPSSDRSGFGVVASGAAAGVPITGVLGDQHAATVGQACFSPGDVKVTYGTGNFLVLNTGTRRIPSTHGLLTTIAYQFDGQPPTYALEGSIAVTGSAIQWLRDQLGIIASAADVEPLAASVPDTAGMAFVPAFSGLYAPHWRPDARGAIVGLSRFHTKAHLARAALEAICFQTAEVVRAMLADVADAGLAMQTSELKVDGGVTANALAMQLQADILGYPVVAPEVSETTALGAAYAAGLACDVWQLADIETNWRQAQRWNPQWSDAERAAGERRWSKAVERTLGWVETEVEVELKLKLEGES